MEKTRLAGEAKAFIALTAKKKALKAELAQLEKDLGFIQETLTGTFVESGVSKITVDGATVYMRTDQTPKLLVPEGEDEHAVRLALVHELEAMGHSGMLTYNHTSMKSLCIELADSDGNLPPPLCDYIKLNQEVKVVATGVKPQHNETEA